MTRRRIGFLACLLLILCCHEPQAFAQTHSVSLAWSDSVVGATYNVLRASCSGAVITGVCSSVGSFTALPPTAANATSYVDTAVTQGQLLVYEVTATCVAPACGTNPVTKVAYTGTSLPSNLVAVVIPTPTPNPTPIPIPPLPITLTIFCPTAVKGVSNLPKGAYTMTIKSGKKTVSCTGTH